MDVSEATPTEREEDLLNDDRELDEPGAGDADPVHLARCADCRREVRYRSNVTGSGFFLIDADPDAVFGAGSNGRPVCPDGHGEMAIADDQFKPVGEAFSEAQTMLQSQEGGSPQQMAIPGVFPAFNYAAVFQEIVDQAKLVERLKAEHDAAKEEAASAKKSLDKGAELLMRMTLEFERRRKEKPTAVETTASDRQPCAWEAKRTDGESCPVCSGTILPFVVNSMLKTDAREAVDAQAHVDEVEQVLLGVEVHEVHQALDAIDVHVAEDVIAEWTSDERKAVTLWADAVLDARTSGATVDPSTRPAALGTPHIPSPAVPGELQVCALCEVVIAKGTKDDPHFDVTHYVGVDCPGKVVADGHRYPKGKKKAAKQKDSAR